MQTIGRRLRLKFKRKRQNPGEHGHQRIVPSSAWNQPPRISHTDTLRPPSPTTVTNTNNTFPAQPNSSHSTVPATRRKIIIRLKILSKKIRSPRKLGRSVREALKKLMPQFTTSQNTAGSGGFSFKDVLRFGKPTVSLSFIDTTPSGENVTTNDTKKVYSTYDTIQGTVTVVSKSDCRFDDIEIAMTGITKTFVDKLSNSSAVTGRSEAIHRFLKLVQPVYSNELPPEKILAAGKTYQFPFTFVVPARLMPRACMHQVISPHIKELHLMLPPTLGEKGNQDGAGEHSKISYKIAAKLTRNKNNNPIKKTVLCEATQKIRIRPASDEMPPLNVEGDDTYCLRSEKTIRDGLLKARNGSLIVEATQPKGFRLKQPGADREDETSYVRLQLRFDPDTDNAIPPKLNSLLTKLKVTTHFATTTRKDLPRKTVADLTSDALSDVHNLSNYSVASVDWNQHKPGTHRHSSVASFRRDSTSNFFASTTSLTSYDTNEPIRPSSSYREGALFYTAQISVPVSLPNLPNRQFLPTFHTCLISRTYLLQLALSLSGSLLAQPLKLIVPVQVSADSSAAGAERQRLATVAENAMIEAANAFEPRYTGPALEISDGMEMVVAAREQSYSDQPPRYETPGFTFGGNRPVYG